MLIKSWFENADSSDDPFLWAPKENSKATGKSSFHFFKYENIIVCSFCLMSREYDSGSSQGRVTQTKKIARQNLNWAVQSVSIAKCFFIQIFSDKTVKLLEN